MGVEGIWYNELGSRVEIMPVAGNAVTGLYETAVSSSGCAKGKFPLQGRTDVDKGGSTIGFAVTWLNATSNCHSTTAWAGQYSGPGANETLTAFWLLVTQTTPQNQWSSTLIGEDHFTRVKPTAAQVEAALARKRHAHP